MQQAAGLSAQLAEPPRLTGRTVEAVPPPASTHTTYLRSWERDGGGCYPDVLVTHPTSPRSIRQVDKLPLLGPCETNDKMTRRPRLTSSTSLSHFCSGSATNRIFRSVKKKNFRYVGQNFGIRGAEHHNRTTLTQPSPTSFPVIQWQFTLCDKCCCILPGIYTALGFQQPLPISLAPCLTCTLSSQTFLHTTSKFREFPRYFVQPSVCFACRMR